MRACSAPILLVALVLPFAGCSDDDKSPLLETCCMTDSGPQPDGPVPAEAGPGEAGPIEGGATDTTADASDPCAACKTDEICVQSFDGTCNTAGPSCVQVSSDCKSKVGTPGQACDSGCESAYCASPYQCANQVPCGTEAPNVDIYCYGP